MRMGWLRWLAPAAVLLIFGFLLGEADAQRRGGGRGGGRSSISRSGPARGGSMHHQSSSSRSRGSMSRSRLADSRVLPCPRPPDSGLDPREAVSEDLRLPNEPPLARPCFEMLERFQPPLRDD